MVGGNFSHHQDCLMINNGTMQSSNCTEMEFAHGKNNADGNILKIYMVKD